MTRYFDHAASSWPKPPEVAQAMSECLQDYSANPGRGSHRMAIRAGKVLAETRGALAKLFHAANPNDIVFTLNTTHALNLAIKGLLREGDHAVSTSVEHNSVRRPLTYLSRSRGVAVSYSRTTEAGHVDMDALKAAIQTNTRLIACNHASNLLGTIQNLPDIAQLCREHKLILLVDAAQTAGAYPIDVERMGIDMLAFPGHKGLLGPQGTGGLYIRPGLDLEPQWHGGTGSQSQAGEQPDVRPDRYEAGTPNTVGLAGLLAGVRHVLNETVQKIHTREWELAQQLMKGLSAIDGLRMLGPAKGEERVGIVSFVMPNMESAETAFLLDRRYDIAVRAGYHCTPQAHEAAGTLDTGAVRASVGYGNTPEDVQYLIDAVRELSRIK